MNITKRAWTNLILAPLWFLILIVAISIYFGGFGVNEKDIPDKITENTPLLILMVQVLLFATLLITTRKDHFNIFKAGWTIDKTKIRIDIFGGILTGAVITVLYFYVFSPLQYYLQLTIGDYVPPGETMHALGQQTILFFIANVLFAPFVEESLYRNYALTKFLEKYSPIKSILLTAVLFGLLHWVGGIWYILMTGVIIGLPFAYIAIKRGNIVWVFIAHFTLNLLEFIYITSQN
jgi:membrane protease YdiL (CAAX protease family)